MAFDRPPSSVDLTDPSLFLNRELSWLAFNERVLREATNPGLPLYERIKFLALFSANLDEFFMVRVAGLRQQLAGGVVAPEADGMLPADQLAAISERVHGLVARLGRLWGEELVPALNAAGVSLLSTTALDSTWKVAAREHFTSGVFPALTPLAVDPGHPFPHLRNKSLNIAAVLRRQTERRTRGCPGHGAGRGARFPASCHGSCPCPPWWGTPTSSSRTSSPAPWRTSFPASPWSMRHRSG